MRSLLFLSLLCILTVPATAEEDSRWQTYDPDSFKAAQAEGRAILVDVFATWCPVCKRQAPILTELLNEPAMNDVMAVKVNWDSDKDFVQEFRIPRQSTVLTFVGTEETSRSIAETDREKLRTQVLEGVGQ